MGGRDIYNFLIYKEIYIYVYILQGVLGSLSSLTQNFPNSLSPQPIRCSTGILEANKIPDR